MCVYEVRYALIVGSSAVYGARLPEERCHFIDFVFDGEFSVGRPVLMANNIVSSSNQCRVSQGRGIATAKKSKRSDEKAKKLRWKKEKASIGAGW